MNKSELFNLLDQVQEDKATPIEKRHDRVLIFDGLNLFFRNFATMNMVNNDGVHIGGLGGFLRSLGAMVKKIQPTSVYIVFDGQGSSANRKNLISEYKGTRNLKRLTNWTAFDNYEEEHDSKIDQIVRVIQYLKLLPIKVTIMDKVEADDVIAVLTQKLSTQYDSNCYIISSDKDFLQLLNPKVVVYRPMEKVFYTTDILTNKFNGILPSNFIIYKTLMGDVSDNVKGIKGLGEKKLFKFFPELKTQPLTMQDIFDISGEKMKEHVVYARIYQEQDRLLTQYKVMDLSKPMISEKGIEKVENLITEDLPELNAEVFLSLYNQDQLGGMIRNPEKWLSEIFLKFPTYEV